MSEKDNLSNQPVAHATESGDIMNHIQDMIGDLLKNAVDKMHKEEHSKGLGGTHKGDAKVDATPHMGISDIKNFVAVMQKFIDNVNIMIIHLETGSKEHGSTDDLFLDGYMATADNVLEIAAFSMKDTLTGLSNRHGFENRLILEWNRATRDKSALGLAFFGMDCVDGCKDSKRHDEMLKAIAKTLEGSIKRSTDFIARWSDEEFAVLLPITDEGGASIVAERIRNEMESMSIPELAELGCKSTVSIGVCDHAPEHTELPIDFINKAHDAYTKAKETGGNSIVFA